MSQLSTFRSTMATATNIAAAAGSPVRPEHVTLALASTEPGDPTAQAIIAAGERDGLTVRNQTGGFLDRLRRRRSAEFDPRLRRAIEAAAASGAPDIRVMLASLRGHEGMNSLRGELDSAGLSLDLWLGVDHA